MTIFNNPNYGNVGMSFKFEYNENEKTFKSHEPMFFLCTIEHREHNQCLNGEILHVYPLNELI